MTQPHAVIAENPKKEARTANWVAFIICTALVFDGYDLVIYGTVLPGLLADPSQIGAFDTVAAGLLGSWALIGVLVGSLICGAVGDFFGRRRLMLLGIAWFSVGMFVTAFATSVTAFGALRFVTGLGLGVVIATAGATMAEFAPAGRRQFYNAIVYSGVPAGGVLASILGILLLNDIGWRGLFMIGALPLVLLVPIAWFKLPESPRWLLARGREQEAQAASHRTGVPLIEERVIQQVGAAPQKTGFAAVFSRQFAVPSILLGLMSFCGLLLTYGLNTWLPKIMEGYGYGRTYSLFFPLALNLGAVAGGLLLSRLADKGGPQRVIASTFVLATISLVLMTFSFPLPLLFTFIAFAGVGTLGTQVLIYGFQSNYYTTNARAAGVAWCASVGRFGGILGPIIGGWLAAAGIGGATAFYIYGAVALVGAVVTVLVPRQRKLEEAEHKVEEIVEGRTRDSIPSEQLR
ncbi:MFS transporter [Pseudarthrobacter raffinosi]|uniref:MFS transporter n=1 Tax=Pseudarthrobacter raffinosi TaxID=2953651 RepID=UPI00208E4848|nr:MULTISPECIES: aromatic acid/H+ symport family MFS transporter [unclassified Pseudarthrobacter]MCO4253393.1 aromatic acid/H+ symport family MFS transporter [Pseudarthrobacter sp. MDT3-9]MCO4262301.1 aromatic acid/H+ symport family MFS transporter [Pseudarthrobacter sp. MDT3-26]